MKLSIIAIELCRIKFGQGMFCGFDNIDTSVLQNISKMDVSKYYNELIQSGIIDFYDGNIHISALGQHIFNMLIEPELYLMLDNKADDICTRVYVRNTYYLCVMEDRKEKSSNAYDEYILELLPRLELVIGSFAYTLHYSETHAVAKKDGKKQDIEVVGKAWDKHRKMVSQIEICGTYFDDRIHYQMTEWIQEIQNKMEEFESDVSGLINKLTEWMFREIKKTYIKGD